MKNNRLTSRFLLILFTLLSMSLSGCAPVLKPGLVGKCPIIDDDNFATIHLARAPGFAGCRIQTNIQIHETDFYLLACGDHIAFRVPINQPITISQTTSAIPDHIEIEPEKSKQYYLVNDCNGYACWLSKTSKSGFTRVVKDCREVTYICKD